MTRSIPLIRSAVLMPMIRWMRENGRPVQARLDAAGLGYASDAAPERPVPLLGVLELFRSMGALEGPDIGVRAVATSGLADLGTFGRLILEAGSPRDALQRAIAALPRYSTHELLSLHRRPGGLCVRAGWSLILDDTAMHLTQQFTAMLVHGLCAATGRPRAAPRSIRIRPHPDFGLNHLRPWFGPVLSMAEEATLDIDIDDDVLDAALPVGQRSGFVAAADWAPLKGDGSFSQSVRLVMHGMADDAPVSIARLARSAGMSARSVQRLLTCEGTSFRRLSDQARRARALEALPAGLGSLSSVATVVGYSAQSSLSRAVRRWTGVPPKRWTPAMATPPMTPTKARPGGRPRPTS